MNHPTKKLLMQILQHIYITQSKLTFIISKIQKKKFDFNLEKFETDILSHKLDLLLIQRVLTQRHPPQKRKKNVSRDVINYIGIAKELFEIEKKLFEISLYLIEHKMYKKYM